MNIQPMETPDKKQAVLDAMLALVVSNGFHGTPMSLVAKQAGVAASTKQECTRNINLNIGAFDAGRFRGNTVRAV
jgi:hypothetical protein